MYCKNCGYPLVEGQIICSNCNTENIVETSNSLNEVNNNYTNYNQTNFEQYNYESDFVEEKPKKEKNIVLIIVFAAIFVPIALIGLLALVTVIATANINSTLEKARKNQIVEEYRMIKKTLQSNYSIGEEVVCDNNCSTLFDYNKTLYELEVTDEGSYFKIELESKNSSLDLTTDHCKNIDNTVCSGSKIIGRIYKQ